MTDRLGFIYSSNVYVINWWQYLADNKLTINIYVLNVQLGFTWQLKANYFKEFEMWERLDAELNTAAFFFFECVENKQVEIEKKVTFT